MNVNNTSTHRQCSKCKEIKELNTDNFHKSPIGKYGYNYYCKICSNNSESKKSVKYITEKQKIERRLSNREKYQRKKNKMEASPEYKQSIQSSWRKAKNKLSKKAKLYKSYKKTDKKKGRDFNLTLSFIEESLNKPCVYCGFPATGLDRLNNAIGHIEENCVPCCVECNVGRMDNFTHEEMKIIGQAIKIVKLNRVLNIK